MTFKDLGLKPGLLKAIDHKGYTVPTPIQEKAIPPLLKRRDVLGGAQTGTGKTAAFALPLLQNLSEGTLQGKRTPRALILCPTRELAAQILESFRDYGSQTSHRAAAFFGGVKIGPQISELRRGLDILVATPGRLLDHLQQKTLDLSRVEILVLDEADRMLDMGFINDIRKVIQHIPTQRQTMLFSATFSKEIKKLASQLLKNPVLVEINPENNTADTVDQSLLRVDEKAHKRHLLTHLIKEENWYQVLVFTRTKHGAKRLAKQLTKSDIPAADIHGDKSQNARTRALAEFKTGKLQVLVATDIAARGLDISKLDQVVNFDLPDSPEDYVHRIGRTGRAGSAGKALSFCSPDEKEKLRGVEKLLNRRIPLGSVTGFTPPPTPRPQPQKNPQQQQNQSARSPRTAGNHRNNGRR